LDSLSEIVALADALQIAPSELMRLPVPAPANGETDSAINAVFLALMATRRSRAGRQALPVEALSLDPTGVVAESRGIIEPGRQVGRFGLARDLGEVPTSPEWLLVPVSPSPVEHFWLTLGSFHQAPLDLTRVF
jgi:hypothetical protein